MTPSDIHRRAFVRCLAGGAAGLTAGTAASADDPKAATADLSSVPHIELLLELVRRVDPEQLQREHLEQLHGDLEVNLQRSARLSAFALTNADEPAPTFSAWRLEG
ncbi:MAG TPA: hypothetical protein VNH11_11300 [Pirellulales bacterium]|nr:hypothetical protein [Pirellulales bacterium]